MKTKVWKTGNKINIRVELYRGSFEFQLSKKGALRLAEQLARQLLEE